MAVKVAKATKDLAYQKLRDGLGNKEVAELTGLSLRSIGRMKSLLDGKSALPARNARIGQAHFTGGQDKPHIGNDENKTTLEFEDSPEPVEQKSIVDSAFSSLKGMLGISDKQETKRPPPPLSAKLDAKQQKFVDAVSPTLALAAMSIAAWWWGRIGPEYAALAPDEKTAQQIVEPLLRVYARHANFLMDINPDVADIGASVFALVGYVNVSLSLYQQIKRDQEQGYEQENPINYTTRRRAAATASENGTGNAGRGHVDVFWGNGSNGSDSRPNGGGTGGIDPATLSDKEARQYTALSRLAELDYQHRARRSMRAG